MDATFPQITQSSDVNKYFPKATLKYIIKLRETSRSDNHWHSYRLMEKIMKIFQEMLHWNILILGMYLEDLSRNNTLPIDTNLLNFTARGNQRNNRKKCLLTHQDTVHQINFFDAEKENSKCIKIELVHVCMCIIHHNQESMYRFGTKIWYYIKRLFTI